MHQREWSILIRIGDVVLINTSNKPRLFRLLGRVFRLIIGHDNIVRSAKLKRANGVECHHSIAHLYPMELSLTHCGDKNTPSLESGGEVDMGNETSYPAEHCTAENSRTHGGAGGSADSVPSWPSRRAAAQCRQLIQDKLHLLK